MTYLLWKYTIILEICASMCVFYIYLCYICKLMCISVWYTLFYVYTVCPEYQIKMQHLKVLQSQVKILKNLSVACKVWKVFANNYLQCLYVFLNEMHVREREENAKQIWLFDPGGSPTINMAANWKFDTDNKIVRNHDIWCITFTPDTSVVIAGRVLV